MKTAAWETAPQIALRNCFKEVMEEGKTTAFFDLSWVPKVELREELPRNHLTQD